MKRSAASPLVQDEASCVVFGMPKEAIECGGAQITSPLNEIPDRIIEFAVGELCAVAA